jgi:UDP-glucose 4-epimerase
MATSSAVLVTGGAGYIGSCFVEVLRKRGENVVVLDNLGRGHRAAVPPDVPFYEGDVSDKNLVSAICRKHSINACVHFAAFAYVGESVTHPEMYFRNNVAQSLALFEALTEAGVKHVVFSSSCSTYGEVKQVPISEAHPQAPINPYAWSKFFVERMLEAFDAAHGLKFVALRYFNAAGALPNKGEHHEPETHLIPLVLEVAQGRRKHVGIFGDDYDTPDGTCIRDYIHIEDLADAHVRALDYLRKGKESVCLNLGTGTGSSVLDIIETCREITGKTIAVKNEPRRAGDPARLVASAEKAHSLLGWKPAHNLRSIIKSAWDWHNKHPKGYD